MKVEEPDLIDLVQSSLRDIEVFEQSTIWIDMKGILLDWNNGLKDEYDKAANMEEVKFVQGISECLKYVLHLPEAMKAIVSNAQEQKEVENES